MNVREQPRAFRAAWIILLTVLAILVYYESFSNPFVYDDVNAIRDNQYIRSFEHTSMFFQGKCSSTGAFEGHFRPLTMLSFALNYQWSGLSPWSYRLVNLLLHLLCGALVYLVTLRFLAMFPLFQSQTWEPEQRQLAALVATTLFVLHPLHSQSILLVWKRTSILATCFYLLALLCFLHLEQKEQREGQLSWRTTLSWNLAVVGFFVLSLMSKETGITLPIVLLLTLFWPRPERPKWTLQRVLRMAGLQALLWTGCILMLTVFFPDKVANTTQATPIQYLFTQAKVIWLYVAMIVNPTLIAIDYNLSLVKTMGDPLAWFGGFGLLLLIGFALTGARRFASMGLLILAAFVTLSPASSLVPNIIRVDENRMYLPLIFVWIGLGVAFVRGWSVSRRARWLVGLGAGLFVVVCLGVNLDRVVKWSKPSWLWLDAIKKYPGAANASAGLCADWANQPSKAKQALPVCRQALQVSGNRLLVYESLIAISFNQKRRKQAESWAQQILQEYSTTPRAFQIAGDVARLNRDDRRATQRYQQAIALNPHAPIIRLYLAETLRRQRRIAEAQQELKRLGFHRFRQPQDAIFRAWLHFAVNQWVEACQQYDHLRQRLHQIPRSSSRRWRRLQWLCQHKNRWAPRRRKSKAPR
ncbi:MAG: tetratricopeptide repeat protein [Deltaproteobacteria bacterium]|nr:MAG: tetratricopeptide repeat protein [Deltaproteobacteria bacterium]